MKPGTCKRIPLRVSDAENITYSNWPVTQGIPFPDRELEAGAPVLVVDSNGKPIPTQSAVLAAWISEYSSLWPVDDEFHWFQWSHKTPAEHVNFVALAYELTGDFTYAAYAKHFIFGTFLRQVKRFKHSADWRFLLAY